MPPKIDGYLNILNRLYEKKGESLLREIVVNAVVHVEEGATHDKWNGGTDIHDVRLTISEDLFMRMVDRRAEISKRIATDLGELANTANEWIGSVFIEMELPKDEGWREGTGLHRGHAAHLSVSDHVVRRIWGTAKLRVFLSHKSSIKKECALLKQVLDRCGIGAFLAHEDIQPTIEWQREIDRALFSMDCLVALLSGDFHDSEWTDQEVGVGLGRGVPVIAVRLGRDPYGLMGKAQAVGGCDWSDTGAIVLKILDVLHKVLPDKSKLFESALSAYAASTSFDDSGWRVRNVLAHFGSLTPSQVDRVLDAYRGNEQNRHSYKGRGALITLLKKWTGKQWRLGESLDLIPWDPTTENINF